MLERHTKTWLRVTGHFLVMSALIIQSTLPASAGLFSGPKISIPKASDVASDIERRYHINTASIQEQGETLNVSDNKKGTPEVSIFFSPSDPKEGQKITARSFPLYFSSDPNDMYYTWYLQRADCRGANAPSDCDQNRDGRVDVEDWKIEAARIIATNGYDANFTSYASDTDNDGFDARKLFGSQSRVNMEDHCYYHDNETGENFEMVGDVGDATFACGPGLLPVCMEGNAEIESGDLSASASGGASGTGGTASAGGSAFEVTPGDDSVTGYPYCSGGTVACITGTPCCVANPSTATDCTENITGSACSVSTSDDSSPKCRHLFAKSPVDVSGNGDYGASEEQFWLTDPNDANTSDNGNKDEANIIGLGQDSFTWNYSQGDKVGVVVEGVSMIPTKHDDSSNMIMWAFSKNKCDYQKYGAETGSYQKSIRGYSVTIPTIKMDLNDCLEDNLVDPLEGGQATNLDIELNATPDDPMNDSSGNKSGDAINVVATINNGAQELQHTFFDWKVDISRNGTPNPPGATGWRPITGELGDRVSQTRGNGVGSLTLKLNFVASDFDNLFNNYVPGGVGYLRFRVDAAENFNGTTASRRGKTDIIVRFVSTSDRIAAYVVNVSGDPAKLALDLNRGEICDGVVIATDPAERQILTRLDAKLCRVIKNEIIGLKVITSNANSQSYNWTINGQPLVCTTRMSGSCSNDQQGGINFFPVIGNVGDIFTLTVSSAQTKTDTGSIDGIVRPSVPSGKMVTLTRSFKIVDPEVAIVSADENEAWPKVLGRYTDANGGSYIDYSKTTLQAFSGATVRLRALFTPDFVGAFLPPQVERAWAVDGAVPPGATGSSNEISFATTKDPGSIYNVTLAAAYRPRNDIRKALQDIWQISGLDSTEFYFRAETQLEHPEETELARANTNKFLALLSSYVPASLLFSIRIFLSAGLILFITGFIFALIPEAPSRLASLRRRT